MTRSTILWIHQQVCSFPWFTCIRLSISRKEREREIVRVDERMNVGCNVVKLTPGGKLDRKKSRDEKEHDATEGRGTMKKYRVRKSAVKGGYSK